MPQDPVLVTYGSTRGGTAEIAQWIATALREEQTAVELRPAREVRSLDGYRAVIIGGALYAGRWHRHARRLTRRLGRQLRERPVWVFGSGPLDHSADDPGAATFGAKAVRKAADRVGARAIAVFGGRLESSARGFPAAAMAKTQAGDYRNRDRIESWAKEIAAELH